MKHTKKIVFGLIVLLLLMIVLPMVVKKGSGFGGSDDAGSQMVEEVNGEAYEPWFTPVLEQMLGGELPGEVESLVFCVQTGIGVGILAYAFGYLVARKKYGDKE